MRARILLAEDDVGLAGSLEEALQFEGHDVAVVHRRDAALACAEQHPFDVMVADVRIPGLSGLELVRQLHLVKPQLPIILMTAYDTPDTAIEAARLGAFDYVLKPFDVSELLGLISKAVSCNRAIGAPLQLGADDSTQPAIIGHSRAMQQIYKEIGHASATSLTVLLRGATGTGKELVARAIHQHSSRAAQPFIPINCAAIPETLLESDLFGHERGSFTGAHARRIGRFEQARSGTIFLDEIGDLSPGTQAKLLRVLQEKVIQRVGGNETIAVESRVVAATHRDLEAAMDKDQFREDLFYRLNALTIQLPPLSERLEDVPELVKYLVRRAEAEVGTRAVSIESEALDFLQNQAWPGNVRQLENVIRHAMLLSGDHLLSLAHVQQAYFRACRRPCSLARAVSDYLTDLLCKAKRGEQARVRARMAEDMERQLFARAIKLACGNQAEAARLLGVTRRTVRKKLLRFGLHGADASPPDRSV